MGPTRVHPLAQARLIVRQCMERDAEESDAAEMTHRAVMSRAFGRGRDRGPVDVASSTSRSSSGEGALKPADELTTRAQITPIFVFLCIIVITVAWAACRWCGASEARVETRESALTNAPAEVNFAKKRLDREQAQRHDRQRRVSCKRARKKRVVAPVDAVRPAATGRRQHRREPYLR